MAKARVALRAVGHAWAEIDTAFVEHGWRGEARQEGPWHARRSMSAPGELAIAARRDGGFSVFNGLLLSALWDAAFDGGLVSFDDDGRALASATLTEAALATLRPEAARIARLSDEHRRNLARHREHVFDRIAGAVADEHAIVSGGRRP